MMVAEYCNKVITTDYLEPVSEHIQSIRHIPDIIR
jgi:hypothetical protein